MHRLNRVLVSSLSVEDVKALRILLRCQALSEYSLLVNAKTRILLRCQALSEYSLLVNAKTRIML